ncbi:MAG: TIGR03792 family protein [Cyanobacteria bacterium P01_G01_bin.4]
MLLGRAIALSILLWNLGSIGLQMPGFERQIAQASDSSWPNPVVVEWLEFRVPLEEQAEFLAKDEQIWTAALRQQSGFLHKSIWTSPDRPEFVTLAIYWASREDWFAFPEALIDELDRQMQPTNAELVDSREFRVLNPAGGFT